jgi:hypothetical protein
MVGRDFDLLISYQGSIRGKNELARRDQHRKYDLVSPFVFANLKICKLALCDDLRLACLIS